MLDTQRHDGGEPTSSLTGTSVRSHRLRSASFPLILSFRFNTLLFLLILDSDAADFTGTETVPTLWNATADTFDEQSPGSDSLTC